MIGLYYYGEATMKQIGAEIGVNESRVSQLHARAIRRLKDALGDMNPQKVAELRRHLLAFTARKPVAATMRAAAQVTTNAVGAAGAVASAKAVVLPYKPARRAMAAKAALPGKATLKVVRPRQAVAAAR